MPVTSITQPSRAKCSRCSKRAETPSGSRMSIRYSARVSTPKSRSMSPKVRAAVGQVPSRRADPVDAHARGAAARARARGPRRGCGGPSPRPAARRRPAPPRPRRAAAGSARWASRRCSTMRAGRGAGQTSGQYPHEIERRTRWPARKRQAVFGKAMENLRFSPGTRRRGVRPLVFERQVADRPGNPGCRPLR